jgi:hypothetical protein
MSKAHALAVVAKEETTVAAYQEPVRDNGNWGDDDEPSLPDFISLRQALSEGVDHIPLGVFYQKESGQTWTTLNMIILNMHKGRTLKKNAPKFDGPILCKSVDGKFPIVGDDRYTPQAKSCDDCGKNSWAGYDKTTGEGSKPLCNKDYYILFIDEETNLPYVYTPSGKGYDPCVALKKSIKKMADLSYAKDLKAYQDGTLKTVPKMPNTYDFVVSMTSKKEKAYMPVFTQIRRMKLEDAAKFGPIYEQFVTSRANSRQEEPQDDDGSPEYIQGEDTGAVIEADEVTVI